MVLVGAGAVSFSVSLSIHPTGIKLLWAARGWMIPPMALEAAESLLLALLGIDLFLTDEYSISECVISSLWREEGKDCVTTNL